MTLISYDPRNAFLEQGGLGRTELADIASRLDAARAEVLEDARIWMAGGPVPKDREPLDAGFIELPERLLADFQEKGEHSLVSRLRASADRLSGAVDRVVLLGIGGSYMGARAILEALCHPFHNEMPRDVRRGRPRLYFEGNNVDNDAFQGLVDLLGQRPWGDAPDDRWGIVVVSKSGGTLETAAAFRLLARKLRESLGEEADLGEWIVPVTGTSGKLFELARAIGCREIFPVPEGVGGRFSVLSAVGLLPAAILGLDIERLLAGAAAMNEHFRTARVADNLVLQFTGVCHLMEAHHGSDIRVLSTWGKRMEAAGLWHDQLLAESLGKQERGALPLTVVNTRDLHSRGQQHQEGKRDKLITNVIVDQCDREPLAIGRSTWNQDGLDELASKTLPTIMAAAIAGTNQAYGDDNRPTADLHLPRLDEYTLGQYFQMLMLATVVEGRLIGINPYGQPGVEAYKRNMNAILRGQ